MSNTPNPDPLEGMPDGGTDVLHDGDDDVSQAKLSESKGLDDRMSDAFEEMIPGEGDDDGR